MKQAIFSILMVTKILKLQMTQQNNTYRKELYIYMKKISLVTFIHHHHHKHFTCVVNMHNLEEKEENLF
mgnify:CR=1 FL=1